MERPERSAAESVSESVICMMTKCRMEVVKLLHDEIPIT